MADVAVGLAGRGVLVFAPWSLDIAEGSVPVPGGVVQAQQGRLMLRLEDQPVH